MGDIIAVYTIPGEIGGVAVTKIVYVLNSALDTDCGEIVKYSDGSDGTGWVATAGGSIDLQTNGVSNQDQSFLNLIAGSNILLTNVNGDVEISNIYDPLNEFLFRTDDFIVQRDDITLYSISFNQTKTFTQILLPYLESVTTDVLFTGTMNGLDIIDLSSLQNVGGVMQFTGHQNLTSLDISALESASNLTIGAGKIEDINIPLYNGGGLSITLGSGTFTDFNSIDISSLLTTGVGSFVIIINNSTLFAGGTYPLQNVGGAFVVGANFGIPVIYNFSSLLSIGGSFDIFGLCVKEHLYPSLISIGGNVSIPGPGQGLNICDTIDLSSLQTVGGSFLMGLTSGGSTFPLITSMNLSSLISIGGDFRISRGSGLTTITLSNTLSITGTTFDFRNNALSQSSVDDILNKLDLAGQNNKILQLQGGTNSTPSAAGLVSKSNLQARGWTVNNN